MTGPTPKVVNMELVPPNEKMTGSTRKKTSQNYVKDMARILKIIFRFAMVVGEEVFLAEVQEKKKALETYNEAVDNGQSAGESNFDDFS